MTILGWGLLVLDVEAATSHMAILGAVGRGHFGWRSREERWESSGRGRRKEEGKRGLEGAAREGVGGDEGAGGRALALG